MTKIIKVGKNIFPEFEHGQDIELAKFLDKFDIELSLAYEDGLEFEVPEDVSIKSYPRTKGFYKEGELIFSYGEGFDCIEFFDKNENKVETIKIINPYNDL